MKLSAMAVVQSYDCNEVGVFPSIDVLLPFESELQSILVWMHYVSPLARKVVTMRVCLGKN